MTVTRGNITAGPCTSFTVDTTAVGGTTGGVGTTRKMTFVDLEVDQYVGVVKKILSKDEFTVSVTLSESTLANLQLAWGITAAPVVSTTPATETLNLGLEKEPVEHKLVFVGPCPTGTYTSRTATFNRAISMVSSPVMEFAKDKEQQYKVEFQCLPDATQAAGSEYGTVVDQ